MDVLVSLARWTVSVLHFVLGVPLLLLLNLFLDPLAMDRPLRTFSRNVLWLAGMRLEVRMDPGFDPRKPSIFVANHVNVFDAFTLAAAMPQVARGVELASHFKVPVYGALVKRFGNLPVVPGLQNLPLLQAEIEQYLARGISVAIFPEGSRTPDGTVGRFKSGSFVIAQQLQAPLVPVTQVGAFECHRKGGFFLRSGPVVVHLHATITLAPDEDARVVADRVRSVVAEPLQSWKSA